MSYIKDHTDSYLTKQGMSECIINVKYERGQNETANKMEDLLVI